MSSNGRLGPQVTIVTILTILTIVGVLVSQVHGLPLDASVACSHTENKALVHKVAKLAAGTRGKNWEDMGKPCAPGTNPTKTIQNPQCLEL